VLDKYGAGAGGTRNIAGNGATHLALEQELANLHRKGGALVFSSCYVANDATLSTLGAKLPGCVIFSDNMNHASMIQGIRHSRTEKVIFKHNDMEDLEAKLAKYPKSTPKIIAFESVYSMCGSVAPIAKICDLAEEYGAITFLDEVSFEVLWRFNLTLLSRFMQSACMDLAGLALLNILISKHIFWPVTAGYRSLELLWTALTSSRAHWAKLTGSLEDTSPHLQISWILFALTLRDSSSLHLFLQQLQPALRPALRTRRNTSGIVSFSTSIPEL
jgi:hypothetical protein